MVAVPQLEVLFIHAIKEFERVSKSGADVQETEKQCRETQALTSPRTLPSLVGASLSSKGSGEGTPMNYPGVGRGGDM